MEGRPPPHHPHQLLANQLDVEGFFDHAVNQAFTPGQRLIQLIPAGHNQHRNVGIELFQFPGQLNAVDVRHAQISEDRIALVLLEFQQRLPGVRGGIDLTAFIFEHLRQGFPHDALIFDQQHFVAQRLIKCRSGRGVGDDLAAAGRKLDQKDRPLVGDRIDIDGAAVPLHDIPGDAQSQAVALLALGGVKLLKDLLANLVGNSDAGVADKNQHLLLLEGGLDGKLSPPGHGVERIVDQVEDHFPQFMRIAADRLDVAQVQLQIVMDAAQLGFILEARAGDVHHLLHQGIEIDGLRSLPAFFPGGKILQALNAGGPVFGRLEDQLQVAELGGFLQPFLQQLALADDHAEDIVEMVGGIAGQFAEGLHPFQMFEIGLIFLGLLQQGFLFDQLGHQVEDEAVELHFVMIEVGGMPVEGHQPDPQVGIVEHKREKQAGADRKAVQGRREHLVERMSGIFPAPEQILAGFEDFQR